MSPRSVRHFGPDLSEVGGIASVIRVLAEHRVGCQRIHVHPTWRRRSRLQTAALTLAAASRIMRMGRSEVAHVHLSEGGSFLREGALVGLAGLRGVPVLATIHGARFIPFARRRARLVAAVLGRAHVITCLDREVLAYVRAAAPRAHVELLPNPVAMDDTAPAACETDELVLFAGEIGLRKGADVLAAAWPIVAAQRPRARCVMVGPQGDYPMPMIERLSVRKALGAEATRELMRRARLVTLPSRAEGMPMVLSEAMSSGRPFVASAVGGIPELAREGGGLLVAAGDERGLAQAICALLGDPALAARHGEQGRRFCRESRSVEVLDTRLRRLYGQAERARSGADGAR